ncbi:MAG: phosphate ABC transporter substrate-binding protein [Cellvibrionaceae bacterium]|nr:phosphate ABC transporter substrate-binding protein [Cellvibrionaceae bacterium]|tara:strand:- start:526 stop:960 length:435 start_codon:yes stop_codon:yes gene_type:complete
MTNRRFILTAISLLFLGFSTPQISKAEISIIVHPSNDAVISLKDVKRIYLGKQKHYADGTKSIPYCRAYTSPEKAQFVEAILLKSMLQLKAYWAELLFTGKGVPPKTLESSEAIKQRIASTPAAIGYIDSSFVDESVREIHRFP